MVPSSMSRVADSPATLGVRVWGRFGSRPAGCSISVPRQGKVEPPRVKRGRCVGWTRGSAARHATWLQSVDSAEMPAHRYAFTLTVRSWPASSQEWQLLRVTWLKRVQRLVPGCAWHWVMETQLRGAPHLHGAIVTDLELSAVTRARIIEAWCQVASRFGPAPRRQRVDVIESADGWSRYVAKHSARSAGHAQRREIPPGWETSGRLWGHSRGWVTRGAAFRLNPRAVVQVRRLMASWRRAEAATRLRIAERMPCRTDEEVKIRDHRIASARRAIVAARRVLAGRPGAAAVRGMREWIAEDVQREMMWWVASAVPGAVVLTEDDYQSRRAAWLEAAGVLGHAERRLKSMRRLGLVTVEATAELEELRRRAELLKV